MIKIERLSRLAALLENGAARNLGLEFNLEHWSSGNVRRSGLFWMKKNVCNTAACAVGLGCLSGEFRSDNLKFTMDKTGINPLYAGKENWAAVEAFFGLTPEQAAHLFYEASYAGPTVGPAAEKIVANRIRTFIARNSQSTKKAVASIKRKALRPNPSSVSVE